MSVATQTRPPVEPAAADNDTMWADLIAACTEAGLTTIAAAAQPRREAGEDAQRFIDDFLWVAEQEDVSEKLRQVFALAKADRDSLSFDEIHRALAVIKAGAPVADAYLAAQLPFEAARLAYEASLALRGTARQRYDDAWDALNAGAGFPEALRDPAGGFYNSEGEIKRDATLSFDEKVAKLELLQQHLPARQALRENLQLDEAGDQDDSLFDALIAARDALLATEPATAHDLAYQAKVALRAEVERETSDTLSACDPTKPSDLEHILTAGGSSLGLLGRLYQNALALANDRPDLVAVRAFDGVAWAAWYQSHPGHYFAAHDQQPVIGQAWRDLRPPVSAFTLAGADLTKYRRAVGREELGEGASLQLCRREITDIEAAFADEPAKCSALVAAIAAYHRAPEGRAAWDELKPWQQEAVTLAVRYGYAPPPAARCAECIVDEYETCGGRVTLVAGGLLVERPRHGDRRREDQLRAKMEEPELRAAICDLLAARVEQHIGLVSIAAE